MKKLSILFFAICLAQISTAQKLSEEQKQAILAKKVAFITNELQLTPTEAETFWPVYNQYTAEIESLKKAQKNELLSVQQDSLMNMNSAQLQVLIDKEFVYEQQELDVKKKYFDGEFEKVLSPQKVVKLYRAEQLFKIYLLKQTPNPPPPPLGNK